MDWGGTDRLKEITMSEDKFNFKAQLTDDDMEVICELRFRVSRKAWDEAALSESIGRIIEVHHGHSPDGLKTMYEQFGRSVAVLLENATNN